MTDLLIALALHGAGDADGLTALEEGLLASGRYSRAMEVSLNTLFGRADARRAALNLGSAGFAPTISTATLAAVPLGRFQRLAVTARTPIRDFVTATGAVFKAGRGFYQLNKSEDVQVSR